MAAITRLVFTVEGMGAALLLATAVPACCCGTVTSGPPGTISGRVVFPTSDPHTFTVYVIDANQYWETTRASYLAIPLAAAQLDFSATLPPRDYWLAAFTEYGQMGMLPTPGYLAVLPKSSTTGLDITDWSGTGSYATEIRLVLAVPDPLPLGSPLVAPAGQPVKATTRPYVAPPS